MLQSRIKGSASVLGDGPGFDHIVFNETAPYIKGHSSCTFTDVKIDVYLNMTSGCPDDKAFPRGAWTCGTVFEGPQGAKEAFAACNLDPYCEAVTAGYPGEGISYHLTRGAEVYDPEDRKPGDPSWDKWCPCPNWFTWVCQRPPGFTLPPATTTVAPTFPPTTPHFKLVGRGDCNDESGQLYPKVEIKPLPKEACSKVCWAVKGCLGYYWFVYRRTDTRC